MAHDENGRFKIQYWNGSAWIDWAGGIPTTVVNGWSPWTNASSVITTKIRFVATTIDTRGAGGDLSQVQEIEIRGLSPV